MKGRETFVPGEDAEDFELDVEYELGRLRVAQEARARLASTAWTPREFLSGDELLKLPDPEWLIDGILPEGEVIMLSGPSGKGKSFVGLDWALSVATGTRWLGHKCEKRQAIYIAAEGGEGYKPRYKAWIESKNIATIENFALYPGAVNLGNSVQLNWLIGKLQKFEDSLIFVDTLAKSMVGIEENSSTEIGIIIAAAYQLRDAIRENGNTVVLVHHTGYDTSRSRGSSALPAGIDVIWDITADDPHDCITMTNSKMKNAESSETMFVRLDKIRIDKWGNTSCVVTRADAPTAPTTVKERVQAALREDWQTSVELQQATGDKQQAVNDALNSLLKDEKAERQPNTRGRGFEWKSPATPY